MSPGGRPRDRGVRRARRSRCRRGPFAELGRRPGVDRLFPRRARGPARTASERRARRRLARRRPQGVPTVSPEELARKIDAAADRVRVTPAAVQVYYEVRAVGPWREAHPQLDVGTWVETGAESAAAGWSA